MGAAAEAHGARYDRVFLLRLDRLALLYVAAGILQTRVRSGHQKHRNPVFGRTFAGVVGDTFGGLINDKALRKTKNA